MESNESDIGWQWGEQAKAWVQLADSASTVAEAATIWGYDEELATQWITGWALHHGWAHELHTEGIEQIWHKLRNDTWADAQLDTEPQQHHPLTEPGHHSPFAWEPSAADIVDQPADAWSGLGHHGRYTPSEWSATYAVEPVADTTSRQAQPQPPTAPGLSEADVEEILAHAMSGPSKAEMLAGLAGKESVEALAINWRLTVRQVDGWARQYAQVSWDWPIETPVEHMRAQLRSLKIEDGPRTGYAPSLPEFTERQLR